MRHPGEADSPVRRRQRLLRWTARIGAVSAEALAELEGATVPSARARLSAAERDGMLRCVRPLRDQPALYTVTRAGLRACGLQELRPPRVTAANAAHALACSSAAALLQGGFPGHRVMGEAELRLEERERGAPLASARLGRSPEGERVLHRPHLVLWPRGRGDGLPVAIEVELTAKAPRRLLAICRAWARCREIAGVLYLVAPEAERPLRRAIDRSQACRRIVVVPLAALTAASGDVAGRSAEPSQAAHSLSAGVNDEQ
jgi:hypothetical protein